MGLLPEIFAAILFLGSGGLLFSERFRRSRALVAGAAALALISTYYLTVQIVEDVVRQTLASSGSPSATAAAEKHNSGSDEGIASLLNATPTESISSSAVSYVDRIISRLPQELPGGFRRYSVATSGTPNLARVVEAEYRRDGAKMTISIVDFPIGRSLAADAQVNESREDADSYAHSFTVDGRFYTEERNLAEHTVVYGIDGNGISVAVSGYGISLEEARTSAREVSIEELERIIRSTSAR